MVTSLTTLIVALYSVMLHTLWNKTGGAGVSKDALRNKRRVVKLVTIVTVMFALSWLPIQLILLLKSLNLYPVTLFNIAVQVFMLINLVVGVDGIYS
jgi:allatostatin receptor